MSEHQSRNYEPGNQVLSEIVYFRRYLCVRGTGVPFAYFGETSFSLGGKHRITVDVRLPRQDEAAQIQGGAELLCCATGQWLPPEFDVKAFQKLADDTFSTWRQEGTVPSLEMLPATFQDSLQSIRQELHDSIARTLRVIRWRIGLTNPPVLFTPLGPLSVYEWSTDAEHWDVIFPKFSILPVTALVIRPFEEIREGIASVLQNGELLLGHDLLQEATSLIASNPRGALVLAVSAGEIGIKQYISALVPGTEWLMQEFPSPPWVNMLRKYLPTIPLPPMMAPTKFVIPRKLLATLDKAVKDRNRLIHRGQVDLRVHDLHESLAAIRDVLWLLDYYSGHRWALEYVRQETKKELTW